MALLRAHHLLLMRPRAAFSSRPPPLSSSPCRRALPTTAVASRLLCSHHSSSPPDDAPTSASPSIVADLLDYLNESWTQFHATAEAKRQLLDAGFTLLSENDDWDLQPGGRYFFTRNMSCLIAFAVGEKYKLGNGFNIIAAHTDSPCLKLKPRSASFKSGHQMVNVQTYGGGLWHTWFDRDLTLAGRVILKDADGSFKHELVKVLSDEIGCKSDEIIGMELNVCDTQPSCLGGGNNEFIYSGRLDNLASCYCALRSLMDSSKMPEELSNEKAIRMIALFDNEEVGSNSMQGAGAPTMFHAMRRIVDSLMHQSMGEGALDRAINSSFLVSADMAHALHPNYPDKHEEHHRPELQKGLVIKHNANQRYATSAVTAFLFKEIARHHNLPVQEFVVRNDMGCGSTIGPILASGVGIRTVDCGIPQLSMHSVREMCGKEDVDTTYRHFKAFFEMFSDIDRKLNVD
uniref:aspartyl aminopeptidase n=1 Tax=Oryza glumipatula TaxID=40148 RepID=A0A0D9YKJ3_9ORYZ